MMLVALPIGFYGCSAPLPTYAWSTPEEAMAIMKERAASITTVQTPCDVVLTSPDGESVSLEGALAARNPGWLRIRAWKFNTAVFDLTMTPSGLWVMRNDSPEFGNRLPAHFDASAIAREWSLLTGHVFEEGVLQGANQQDSGKVIINWPGDSGVQVSCVIERKTLLPLSFVAQDTGQPHVRYEVMMEDYRMVDGIAWPHTLTMISDAGTAALRMHSVSLNHELADEAFVVPARSVKQP